MDGKKKLEERLAACGSGGDTFPAVCFLNTCSYFQSLSDLRGDSYYSALYNCMAADGAYGNLSECFLAEILSKAYSGELPEPVCNELIFRILIEPYCDKKIRKEGGK